MSDAALMREAQRSQAKQARQAEALRANLKRRKEQARDRAASTSGDDLQHDSNTDVL